MPELIFSNDQIRKYYKNRQVTLDALDEIKTFVEGLPIDPDSVRYMATVNHFACILKELSDQANNRNLYASPSVDTVTEEQF